MSEIAEQAIVTIQLADFAMADQVGKANILGAGLSVITLAAGKNVTARFAVVVEIELAYAMLPQDFPIEIALFDATGQLVSPGGGQPLRIAQLASIERPQQAGGLTYPRESLRGRTRLIVDFAQGLPLPAGVAYSWRVTLDGDSSRAWTYPFVVAGTGAQGSAAGPIIG